MTRLRTVLAVVWLTACTGTPDWYETCLSEDGCSSGQLCVIGGGEPVCRDAPPECPEPSSCAPDLTEDACAAAVCGELPEANVTECYSDGTTTITRYDCAATIDDAL